MTGDDAVVEFYWRPGCPYCLALRGPLRRSGLPLREVNIWDDPEAAARVRSVADGNETVPTVFVGTHAMVNPGMDEVLAAVREHSPGLTPTEPRTPRWQPAAASLGFALLWVLLVVRMPATTFHVAPALAAAAAPLTHRWLTGAPVPSRPAAVSAVTGLVITLATTAVLTWQGMLGGPGVAGGGAPIAETVLLAVAGAVLGWRLAGRRK
ncbi:glutaredoxin domain-containing protein [Saccharothrix sp. NRRL B-16314]|uniref:glutaredoxin domain-containing protein n=1 Tax=Saccharothrix sp. NRRL B-16314 TaxID=1463825 RepID=UPI000526F7AC